MDKLTSRQIIIIKFIFSRIFPLPFIIVGALLLYFGVKGLLIAIESFSWPHTNATVISSSLRSVSTNKGPSRLQREIRYEFFVQKRAYSGYHYHLSSDTTLPTSLTGPHPKGTQITVYYMPDNPAVNLLEPGLRLKTFIMPAGGLIFFITGILMAIYLPRLMKNVGRATEQGAPQDAA